MVRLNNRVTAALSMACLSIFSIDTRADSDVGVADRDQLQEVIVTAERRSVNIEKTPIAITALSASALDSQGVVDAQGLQDLVPSLDIVNTGNQGTSIAIRGLVSESLAPQGGPSVSYNVDDIYIARTQATGGGLFDISRVEVLEGPQGTLYGKNSTAGAVNIITNDPRDQFQGRATVDVGSYNSIITEGMLNLPVTGQLAVRVAYQTVKHDGYIGQLDDADAFSGRVKVRYAPTDDLSFVLGGHYNHIGGYGPGDVGYSLAPGAVNPTYPWTNNLYQPDTTAANIFIRGADGHIIWDAHFATITYIIGFESLNLVNNRGAGGGSPGFVNQLSHTVSNELRIASEGRSNEAGSLTWVAGLYSFNEAQTYSPTFSGGPVRVSLVETAIPDSSQAAFGQATYAITNRIRLTAGARYTHEYEAQKGTFDAMVFGNTVEAYPITGSTSGSNVSWKGGVESDVTDQLFAYATVTTGYHAGGVTDTIPASAPIGNVYRPEHLIDYEAGIKGRWLNNRVQVSANVFYENFTDMQVKVTSPPMFPTLYNAQKARLLGLESSAAWLATNADLFRVSFIYEDSRYISLCVPSAYFIGSGPITTCPNGQPGYDYKNQPFNYVPKWSGVMSYQHTIDLPNGGSVVPKISSRFKTRYTGGVESYEFPAYTNTDFNLSYNAPKDRWYVMAYVRNLENKPDYTYSESIGNSDVNITLIPVPPRTYGIRASVNF